MRSSSPRRSALRRTLALTATAGMLALVGPVPSAVAQEDSSTEPPTWVPIDVPGGPLSPVGGYEQQQGCMQPNPGDATIEEKPWSQLTLGFEQAHSQGWTGAGTRVAVVDTGINPHSRLPAPIEDGGSNVPKGGATRDCDGHGTIVAGIIAAQPDQETGFVGIAPGTRLMSLRQSSSLWQNQQDDSTIGNTETMAQAIQHAVDNGVDVINISQSSCQTMAQAANPLDEHNRRLQNAVKNAYDQGIVVVAAAGNTEDSCSKNAPGNPTTAVLPAWFDEYVLTVASVNQKGAPSEFTVPGPWVDVAAPGENLTSLDPGVGANTGLASQIATGPEGQPGPIQGTSFAAPYVSGLAALIKQKSVEDGEPLDADEIMDRIEKTALHPGGDNGRNDIVGYGMIDPMAALHNVVPAEHGVSPAPNEPARLGADVIPQRDWPALMIAIGGAATGIAAILFTAFLMNAVRSVRSRQAGADKE
ncbi:type VII secretion-associated serine protease mycosin [Parasphingorhabdus pacifica]